MAHEAEQSLRLRTINWTRFNPFARRDSQQPVGREQAEVEHPKWEVASVRRLGREDIVPVLKWMSHPDSIGHFSPLPQFPERWDNPSEVEAATNTMGAYYRNFNKDTGVDEAEHILPLTTRNYSGEAIAATTIRWRGDPYVPRDQRIASFERLVVNPELWGHDIATLTLACVLSIAFDRYHGYSRGQGAREVRAWIMTDAIAKDFSRNITLFHKFGFSVVPGNNHSWKEYAAKRNIVDEDTDRDAYWYSIKQEDWERYKESNPDIVAKVDQVLDVISLGLAA